MEIVISFIFGVVIGIIAGLSIGQHLVEQRRIGRLRIDQSDPDDGPYLFLELEPGGVYKLQHSKYILLKVEERDYISRD